ncbi:MAG: protein kinase [Planctomycetota bacterium]
MKESDASPGSRLKFGSDVTIDEIADSFAERVEAGENPDVEEYKQKYPHLAERIEAVLPALVMLGDIQDETPARKLIVDDSIPELLGEYQIIQEVGRGGMGIVFEARHVTMGRRVALKILPRAIAKKPGYLERFHTEARSAARLHHTNIVPVFDEGEAEGLHYYAMQFIRGDNLDRVIEDLKHLRDASGHREASVSDAHTKVRPADNLSQQFAASLINGKSLSANSHHEPSADPDRTDPVMPDTEVVDRAGRRDNEISDGVSGGVAASGSCGGLSDSIFGDDDSVSIARSGNQYHRRAAAVGVQVAEALEYAHNHNVLHRDVKPANLILDTEGRVWVTDFGLAKLDEHNLTGTGDVIGTLRYMAPERFSGVADRRSDIYSLGLSIYELCTLEYAFKNVDPADVVKKASNRSPLSPRKLDETIPLDLETIILKAVASDPARRYSSADDMAEDLKLFLADKPIRARRVSLFERFWRVCRRNPVLSSLSACVALLLCVVAIGSVNFAWYQARQTLAEIGLRKESQQNLYHSLVDQVRMRRYTGRIGQRYVSLDAVQRATDLLPELDLHPDEYERCRLELRNEAIAAMALTDLRSIQVRDMENGWGDWKTSALSEDYLRLVEANRDGRIRVIEFADSDSDNIEERTIIELPPPADLEPEEQLCWSIKISPDGRWIGANHHKTNAVYQKSYLYVHDLENPDAPVLKKKGVVDFDFSSEGGVLGLTTLNGIEIISLEQDQVKATVAVSSDAVFAGENSPRSPDSDESVLLFPPRLIRMSESGDQFAVSERAGNGLEIWEATDVPVARWATQTEHNVTALDWDSSRRLLSAGTWKGRLYCWRKGELALSMATHQAEVTQVFIHPFLDFIASYSEDASVRLTNVVAGEEALRVDRGAILLNTGFSADGRLCHNNRKDQQFGIWEIATPALNVYSSSNRFGSSVRYHPVEERLVARGHETGIVLWDLNSRQIVCEFPVNGCADFEFSPEGDYLYSSGNSGVQKWPVELQVERGRIFVEKGEPENLLEQQTGEISLSGSGERIFVGYGFSPFEIDASSGESLRHFPQHKGLHEVQLTIDGKWLISGTQRGNGVYIFDTETGELVSDIIPGIVSAQPCAHPLRNDVFATGGGDLAIWKIRDDGSVVLELDTGIETAICRYSNNGSLIAAKTAGDQLTLIDPESGHPLAFFETAESGRLVDMQFSKDGSSVAMSCFDNLQIWNISAIREELTELGLNW